MLEEDAKSAEAKEVEEAEEAVVVVEEEKENTGICHDEVAGSK